MLTSSLTTSPKDLHERIPRMIPKRIPKVRKLSNLPVFQQSVRKFSSEVETGTVKYFNAPKGYGFITRPEGSEPVDAFAHFTQIRAEGFKTLHQGQQVRYNIEKTERGVSALNIEATTPPPPRQFRPREVV